MVVNHLKGFRVVTFRQSQWIEAGRKLMGEYIAERPVDALRQYIEDKAYEYNVPVDVAEEIAYMAGASELFDGFIEMLEDWCYNE